MSSSSYEPALAPRLHSSKSKNTTLYHPSSLQALERGREKGNRNRAHARDSMWGGRGGGGGGVWGTEAPAANLLFISSFSFAGERKIVIGSFLIMRQLLPGTTF